MDTDKISFEEKGFTSRIIKFCIENKLVVFIFIFLMIFGGIYVAPFDWNLGGFPRNPVPVDAIPDIGENQQIVFTDWMGRSAQDVQDQITYPLTISLLGLPGVKTIRSNSMFGFSIIFIIFNEDIEFYWSRSRVLEKLNSIPSGVLPEGVKPVLGPDATPLGQIFWYTLEGRDKDGKSTGGWDLQELRTIQDWFVRYTLSSAQGVSEVASIGGFVKEYQIDIDPDAMWAYGVSVENIMQAVMMANLDVGARTIELNKVEYIIRGIGFIKTIEDIEKIVVSVKDNVPIRIKEVANVSLGPALRQGVLDKEGTEVVGGVVVTRYGANPLEAIKNVKKKIEEISKSLPTKTLPDGTMSQVKIVPFYDRTDLIYETLGTLNSALIEEILIAIIVVIFMVMHLRSSILISGLLPLAVLMCFIGMKIFKVDANIVALSGIAIAIGTMVDMGIIICENILKFMDLKTKDDNINDIVLKASCEVGSAVITALSTIVVAFLPVFTMEAAEGKLFKPLAYTKTFALVASGIVAIIVIPPLAAILFKENKNRQKLRSFSNFLMIFVGLAVCFTFLWWIGLIIILIGIYNLIKIKLPEIVQKLSIYLTNFAAVFIVIIFLTDHWLPLGPERGNFKNFIFVSGIILLLMGLLNTIKWSYPKLLSWFLDHRLVFMIIFLTIIFSNFSIWFGFDKFFSFIPYSLEKIGFNPDNIRTTALWSKLNEKFPGLGKEFMPPLDEGSFLFMPITMAHASIGEAYDILQKENIAIKSIPEIASVVGKIGRVESALDPAPTSMIETVINYKSEYLCDNKGKRLKFRFNENSGQYDRDSEGNLIPDSNGKPFRQWRDHIKSPDDIWDEIVGVTRIPGTTVAPKLQPIAARTVMLQSGMRAPMGIKVKGPDLESIDQFSVQLEKLLKEVPSIESETVIADRVVGKPYLEIVIDRDRIARYGIMMKQVQNIIEVAVGGETLTTTVEGRERYGVRVRYQRELRDNIESLGRILIPTMDGTQIPLIQIADINYVRGPEEIKSEDTFLTSYVLFDKKKDLAEVGVVEDAKRYIDEKLESGELKMPYGVSYSFAGSFENQLRAEKKMMIIIPLALIIIFLILYFQFRSVPITALHFTGIFVAWSGGFIMIWLYAQPWFLNFSVFGVNMQHLFQIHPINLSTAVWVGFLALFGIATNDGVFMGTYLKQSFETSNPDTFEKIREATLTGAKRRIRPCLMTAGTVIIALIPVLTSTGRGSDIMVPMAIPSFGGMIMVLFTVYVVPVLYCTLEEYRLKWSSKVESSSQKM